jgi:hypothetical protein
VRKRESASPSSSTEQSIQCSSTFGPASEPSLVTADVQSSPGSVAQVRETAAYLTRFAKTRGVAIVMVHMHHLD